MNKFIYYRNFCCVFVLSLIMFILNLIFNMYSFIILAYSILLRMTEIIIIKPNLLAKDVTPFFAIAILFSIFIFITLGFSVYLYKENLNRKMISTLILIYSVAVLFLFKPTHEKFFLIVFPIIISIIIVRLMVLYSGVQGSTINKFLITIGSTVFTLISAVGVYFAYLSILPKDDSKIITIKADKSLSNKNYTINLDKKDLKNNVTIILK